MDTMKRKSRRHVIGEADEYEKETILIADDAAINRDMLRFIFEEQFDIIEAKDGEAAIALLLQRPDEIDMVFLDLIMPKKNGLDVLAFMNDSGLINSIPVIMITGESTDESDEKIYEYGASDIIRKPFAPKVVMRRALNLMALFDYRLDLEEKLEQRTKELKESRDKLENNNVFLMNALSSVVEFRSQESGEHVQRVKYFTGLLLKYIIQYFPKYGITREKAKLICNASALHDIGKIAIPDSILNKPGRLTREEFEEMKKHTTYGCEILEKFKQEENEFYNYSYDICRYHHERYDGRGYPDGLVGDDIPIWAQVVSIVDVYDALVSERVYKTPYTFDEAIRMIHDGECGVFSPDIMECFDLAKEDLFKATEMGEVERISKGMKWT